MNRCKNFICIILFAVLVSFLFCKQSRAAVDFDIWLEGLKNRALESGISQRTIRESLTDISPIERVIELDRKQPEGKWSFTQYRKKIVHPLRIRKGREMMQRYASQLQDVERKYGVAPQYIVALWGIETNYGQNTGGFSIIPALATLAWEGRRAEFFTKELITALHILDEGHITNEEMQGSWAGAMGQNQFMPSSFRNFAVDGNNDGRKDIWTTREDVFASTANYLVKNGWEPGVRWGREVRLPQGFSESMEGLDVRKSLGQWESLGVTQPDGSPIPVADMQASVVAPDGLGGPAYLVYNNYRTIMRWNRSTYFATSVGLLADAIAIMP